MMTQVQPTEASDVAETVATEKRPLTLETLVARMIQTDRDIAAYRRGEMTKEELDALGIKLF